jgi:hypothetical protein
MEAASTLAYYGTATITDLKWFIVQGPGAYLRMDYLKGASLGRVPAFSENS